MPDNLVIAGRAFRSRLIVETGKYRSFPEMARAHAAAQFLLQSGYPKVAVLIGGMARWNQEGHPAVRTVPAP